MIPFLMVWLYFALLISVLQWPNKLSMLVSLVLLAGPPLFLLYRILVAKRKQAGSTFSPENESVQTRMGKVDHDDAGEDQ